MAGERKDPGADPFDKPLPQGTPSGGKVYDPGSAWSEAFAELVSWTHFICSLWSGRVSPVNLTVPPDISVIIFETLTLGPSPGKKPPIFVEPGVPFRRISWPFDGLDGPFDFLTIGILDHFDRGPVK